MSAASKGKALRPWRVREQVARELAEVIIASPHAVRAHSTRTGGFDVHAAREHALELVALAAKQDELERLARALGMGPETGRAWEWRESGGFGEWVDVGPGWPGRLARELVPDTRAPMGRSLARLGQHILDMLDGERGRPESLWLHAPYQPSECHRCHGRWPAGGSMPVGHGMTATIAPCPDCQGTGHNLAGYLPKPEVSPQLRRKRADQGMDADGVRSTSDTWLDTELGQWAPGWGLFRVAPSRCAQVHTPDDLEQGANGLTHRTRVTSRGEHRNPERLPELGTLAYYHALVFAGVHLMYMNGPNWDAFWERETDMLPRWRRGELKHAQQRRERVIRAGSIRVVTQPGPIRVTCEFSIE